MYILFKKKMLIVKHTVEKYRYIVIINILNCIIVIRLLFVLYYKLFSLYFIIYRYFLDVSLTLMDLCNACEPVSSGACFAICHFFGCALWIGQVSPFGSCDISHLTHFFQCLMEIPRDVNVAC